MPKKERLPRGEDNSNEGKQDFKRKFGARTHWLNVGVRAVLRKTCSAWTHWALERSDVRHAQQGAPSREPVGTDPKTGFVTGTPGPTFEPCARLHVFFSWALRRARDRCRQVVWVCGMFAPCFLNVGELIVFDVPSFFAFSVSIAVRILFFFRCWLFSRPGAHLRLSTWLHQPCPHRARLDVVLRRKFERGTDLRAVRYCNVPFFNVLLRSLSGPRCSHPQPGHHFYVPMTRSSCTLALRGWQPVLRQQAYLGTRGRPLGSC